MKKNINNNEDDKLRQCQFCHSDTSIVECHGHYHCTRCGMPNYECCDGEYGSNDGELPSS